MRKEYQEQGKKNKESCQKHVNRIPALIAYFIIPLLHMELFSSLVQEPCHAVGSEWFDHHLTARVPRLCLNCFFFCSSLFLLSVLYFFIFNIVLHVSMRCCLYMFRCDACPVLAKVDAGRRGSPHVVVEREAASALHRLEHAHHCRLAADDWRRHSPSSSQKSYGRRMRGASRHGGAHTRSTQAHRPFPLPSPLSNTRTCI